MCANAIVTLRSYRSYEVRMIWLTQEVRDLIKLVPYRPVKKLGISQVIYNMESKKLGIVGIIYLRSLGSYKVNLQ